MSSAWLEAHSCLSIRGFVDSDYSVNPLVRQHCHAEGESFDCSSLCMDAASCDSQGLALVVLGYLVLGQGYQG